jgi:hypothetical protein
MESLQFFVAGGFFPQYDEILFDAYSMEEDFIYKAARDYIAYNLPSGSTLCMHNVYALGAFPVGLRLVSELTQKKIIVLFKELNPVNGPLDQKLIDPFLNAHQRLDKEINLLYTREEVDRFYGFSQIFLDTVIDLHAGLLPAYQRKGLLTQDLASTISQSVVTYSQRDVEMVLTYQKVLSMPYIGP